MREDASELEQHYFILFTTVSKREIGREGEREIVRRRSRST